MAATEADVFGRQKAESNTGRRLGLRATAVARAVPDKVLPMARMEAMDVQARQRTAVLGELAILAQAVGTQEPATMLLQFSRAEPFLPAAVVLVGPAAAVAAAALVALAEPGAVAAAAVAPT